MAALNYILARLKEPSTYAGLSGIALSIGLTTELYTAVAGVVAAVAGLIAMLFADSAKTTE